MSSAEAIGHVVRDLRRGSYEHWSLGTPMDQLVIQDSTIVDVTAIYDAWIADDSTWKLYEDSVCRPPFVNAAYAWVNRWGNVTVSTTVSAQRDEMNGWDDIIRWQRDGEGDHCIDWDEVEWITTCALFIGGRSGHEPLPTTGPYAHITLPIDAAGVVQDWHWRMATEAKGKLHNRAQFDSSVVSKAITFLNCRNVQVLEPARPRPERRRVDRTGVTVTEIHITPVGKSRASLGRKPVRLAAAGPLSPVRGHLAHYGCHGRPGLLFGKLQGEYWIPPHHRGSADVGEVTHEYDVVKEGS